MIIENMITSRNSLIREPNEDLCNLGFSKRLRSNVNDLLPKTNQNKTKKWKLFFPGAVVLTSLAYLLNLYTSPENNVP